MFVGEYEKGFGLQNATLNAWGKREEVVRVVGASPDSFWHLAAVALIYSSSCLPDNDSRGPSLPTSLRLVEGLAWGAGVGGWRLLVAGCW